MKFLVEVKLQLADTFMDMDEAMRFTNSVMKDALRIGDKNMQFKIIKVQEIE